jgi:hypothetical protein
MTYLEIIGLINRLETIEKTLEYWKTDSYTPSIEATLYNIKRLEQEKEDIKFQLEFPYLLFELFTKAEDVEEARVYIYKRQKDNKIAVGIRYDEIFDYIRVDINEDSKEDMERVASFIIECREKELHEKEQKKIDIKLALNKLTDREKELLGLTN